MFRKFKGVRKSKDTACPAYALGCDNCTPISVLKPEIVIEERRWIPYPLIIRHYIPKPKKKKLECVRNFYYKCLEDWRQREIRRKDKQRVRETTERIERERCLRELRQLHSYHQKLCCNTQSFKSFRKHVKKTEKPKSKYSHSPKRSTKIDPETKKTAKEGISIWGNICCVITLVTMIVVTIFLLL